MTHRDGLNGGFPELEREPAPLPELPDHPTPLELARAYTTVVLGWYKQWPRVVDALHFLYGATMGAKAAAESAQREAHAARLAAERRSVSVPTPARPFDPDSSYNAIETAFNETAREYYRRAKDPSDPMTVAEVIAIARGEYAQSKRESDARQLKTREKWTDRWWKILLIIVSLIAAAVGAHYGWK